MDWCKVPDTSPPQSHYGILYGNLKPSVLSLGVIYSKIQFSYLEWQHFCQWLPLQQGGDTEYWKSSHSTGAPIDCITVTSLTWTRDQFPAGLVNCRKLYCCTIIKSEIKIFVASFCVLPVTGDKRTQSRLITIFSLVSTVLSRNIKHPSITFVRRNIPIVKSGLWKVFCNPEIWSENWWCNLFTCPLCFMIHNNNNGLTLLASQDSRDHTSPRDWRDLRIILCIGLEKVSIWVK